MNAEIEIGIEAIIGNFAIPVEAIVASSLMAASQVGRRSSRSVEVAHHVDG